MRLARFGFGAAAVVAGLGVAASTADAGNKPDDGIKIVVVQGLMPDTSPALVKVLGGPLRDLITAKTGVKGDIDSAPDALGLAKRMKDGECQIGVFHGFEFAWAQEKDADLVPLVVTVYPTGKPQACVVVRADSKAGKLADLAADEVSLPRGSRGHCALYLNRERTEAGPKLGKPKGTAMDVLEAVLAGDAPAALVDKAFLSGFGISQPGAVKQLRVLCESDAFPQNVIAYHKGTLTEQQAADLRAVLLSAHTTPAGKPLMGLWNITRFGEVPADYTDHLAATRKVYPCPEPKETPTGTGGGR